MARFVLGLRRGRLGGARLLARWAGPGIRRVEEGPRRWRVCRAGGLLAGPGPAGDGGSRPEAGAGFGWVPGPGAAA